MVKLYWIKRINDHWILILATNAYILHVYSILKS